MVSLEDRETLISEEEIGSNTETTDKILDLESGMINEFDKPAPGMWLLQRNSKHCCIYRVPERIRRVNPEVYTPQLVIIGPLHYSLKSQALKSRGDITNTKLMGYLNMEQHKKFYLAEFAKRLEGEQTIDELRRIIKEEEEMIRASYSESTVWIKSPQFVDMILHDSVFIIEFILRFRELIARNIVEPFMEKHLIGEPLMDEPCLCWTVMDDLILLENQLPYLILERLFDEIIAKLLPNTTLREFVITYIVLGPNEIRDSSKFRHFTDLVRLAYVETLSKDSLEKYIDPLEHMYTADKLDSGGVEFKAVEEKFSLNVGFEKGCLKLPCFTVYDNSEMILRNMIALEQCHYPFKTLICNYVIFLDYLIDTPKDVEVLVEKGIIRNHTGQDDLLAEMVNKLCLGMVVSGSQYYHIAAEVKAHYTHPINKAFALLKRVYFGNLWTGTATIAATFLLVMTLIQTVTSIIQTKK